MHDQIAEQAAERGVYEPPLLVEVGGFADNILGFGNGEPKVSITLVEE